MESNNTEKKNQQVHNVGTIIASGRISSSGESTDIDLFESFSFSCWSFALFVFGHHLSLFLDPALPSA